MLEWVVASGEDLPLPLWSGVMSDEQAGHVFVSYVRENNAEIDQLGKVLDAARIPYWRDRKSLGPGDLWKAKIRDAIRSDALVFLACFSTQSSSRDKSHMNEELTLAIEEFRKMPPGRTWLIPVRLDDSALPEWELRPGQMLTDLNYVDLFGDDYAPHAAALVTTIGRLMGVAQPNSATTLAAVEQARDSDRAQLLRRLTKEMLPDRARRIELDELISQEVRRILDSMADPERFPSDQLPGSEPEKIETVVNTANHYWNLVAPLCYSLQVATRWADPDQLEPWVAGMRSIAASACRLKSGVSALTDLRNIAALAPVMTVAVSAVASGRWDNLQSLVGEMTVPNPHRSEETVPLLEAVNLWAPFSHAEIAAGALSLSATRQMEPHAAAKELLEGRVGRHYTPVSDWLHFVLRPIFAEQIHDDVDYDKTFNTADIVLGIMSQHLAEDHHGGNPERQWLVRSSWFGRATWVYRRSQQSPVRGLREDLDRLGTRWPPLAAGIFGTDPDQAAKAMTDYEAEFIELSRRLR